MQPHRFAILVAALSLLLVPAAVVAQSSDLSLLTVTIEAPSQVEAGKEFDVIVNAGNSGDQPLTLDSIDVHDEWLAGVRIVSSDPESIQELFHIPIDNSVSFTLKREIPANGTLSVTFRVIGAQAGTFTGNLDVCTTAVECQPVPITTVITGVVPPDVTLPSGEYTELDISGLFGEESSSGDERHNAADLDLLNVTSSIPSKIKVGRTSELVLSLANTGDRPIFIDSIDVHDELLANMRIISTNPPSLQEPFHIPVDNSMSYTMKQTIPAGAKLSVAFEIVADAKGIHAGNIDVCVTYSDCTTISVSTKAR
ncbi:MAG: hypothetical protein P9M14_04790 [Candidatus Alcyoniella australis]|nr:hypothetical protein [Candidatus Alcyoniella australis]